MAVTNNSDTILKEFTAKEFTEVIGLGHFIDRKRPPIKVA
jgi:hypothetical protein